MSEDSCLGQRRTDHGFCQSSGIFLADCIYYFGLEQCCGAFAISCHFLCQECGDLMQCLAEVVVILALCGNLLVASHAVGQHQQCIIGGSISIHGDHVEGIHYICADALLQHLLGNFHICGYKT